MYENKQEGDGPLKSLPNIDINYIKNRATDTTKVVRKAQEVPNVNHIKNRLLSNNKEKDLFDYCGALLTKSKLKHFCKRMGHSRILGKMASLQKNSPNEDDAGFRALNTRAEAETEYISRYRSGEVESKKSVFEPRNTTNGDRALSPAPRESLPPPSFSWSLRFDKDLPVRADSYSVAQKHNQVSQKEEGMINVLMFAIPQYRHYYGYRPGEDRPALHSTYLGGPGSRRPIYQPAVPSSQPASLPCLPPPPPRHLPSRRSCYDPRTHRGGSPTSRLTNPQDHLQGGPSH